MTLSIPFQTVDVFTQTRFLGNPLAIVLLHHPSSSSDSFDPKQQPPVLTHHQKQLIAREFNLSETVFIHITQSNYDDPSAPFAIDIFTTTEELPFAGHPTIGAGWFLAGHERWRDRKEFKLDTRAGVILVSRVTKIPGPLTSPDERARASTELVKLRIPIDFKTHPPYGSTLLSTLKSKLHQPQLEPGDYVNGVDGAEPVASIVKGMSFVLMPLSNEGSLGRIQPLFGMNDAVPGSMIPDEHLGDWKGFSSLYAFVVSRSTESNSIFDNIYDDADPVNPIHPIIRLRTRMFQSGGFEDPATGSAASTLCGWIASHQQNAVGRWRFEVIQGVEMGRESRIGVVVDVERGANDGDGVVSKIELVGGAVKIMEGMVNIPSTEGQSNLAG
ncbi:putative epimerase [Lentinula lateritia]|uniref:Epimerase n=1 Tax=Lentinula aff. lateritia TaxID=2804960 RepID=A0ACC1TM35_9AGAR|nr:putative epimerase [Lentinula aff. lateritia]KAJ3847404.1 putative epimerase [Lentinula lateritia]